MLLHGCANAIETWKGQRAFLFHLGYLFCQKNSIKLSRMQPSLILSWAIVEGLGTSRLSPLQDTTHIITADLLKLVNC